MVELLVVIEPRPTTAPAAASSTSTLAHRFVQRFATRVVTGLLAPCDRLTRSGPASRYVTAEGMFVCDGATMARRRIQA